MFKHRKERNKEKSNLLATYSCMQDVIFAHTRIETKLLKHFSIGLYYQQEVKTMKKRLIKGFSVYQEDIERLNWITSKTGMTNSEVVRYLVKKCAEDPVEQQIIMQDFIDSEGKKTGKERLLRIMSGKKRIKKSCMTQRTQDSAVSSNCLSYSNQETTNNQLEMTHDEIVECIQIAKAKWIED